MTDTKIGLYKFGYVQNLKKCFDFLSSMVGRRISSQDVNDYIESADCRIEYLDANEHVVEQDKALEIRIHLPYKTVKGGTIYGEFIRKNPTLNFTGVFWKE